MINLHKSMQGTLEIGYQAWVFCLDSWRYFLFGWRCIYYMYICQYPINYVFEPLRFFWTKSASEKDDMWNQTLSPRISSLHCNRFFVFTPYIPSSQFSMAIHLSGCVSLYRRIIVLFLFINNMEYIFRIWNSCLCHWFVICRIFGIFINYQINTNTTLLNVLVMFMRKKIK